MIIYDNRDICVIAWQRAGSVLFTKEVLVPSLLSTAQCFLLLYFSEVDASLQRTPPALARIFSFVLGFVVVFRTSMAFDRFFEGIHQLQRIFSKWRDAFAALAAFADVSQAVQAEKGDREAVEALVFSKARLVHWFSLVSAISVQELQEAQDDEAGDDEDEDTADALIGRVWVRRRPANRLQAARQCSNRRSTRYGHSRALVVTAVEGNPELMADITSGAVPDLVGNTASEQDPAQEPTERKPPAMVTRSHLIKQGSSLGIDRSLYRNASFVSSSHDRGSNMQSVVGRLSSMSQRTSFSSAQTDLDWSRRRAVMIVGMPSPEEVLQLSRAEDRVNTVLKWIVAEISLLTVSGKLLIAPPILTRVFQELSSGLLAFTNVRTKISTVPFPFPFAQVVCYALYAFYVFCPFVILDSIGDMNMKETVTESIVLPLLLNFTACVGYAAANEIAIELEEPFGFDANDYPVHAQQVLTVQAMEDVYFARTPTDFTLGHFTGRH